jgi:hypothetical protein
MSPRSVFAQLGIAPPWLEPVSIVVIITLAVGISWLALKRPSRPIAIAAVALVVSALVMLAGDGGGAEAVTARIDPWTP